MKTLKFKYYKKNKNKKKNKKKWGVIIIYKKLISNHTKI